MEVSQLINDIHTAENQQYQVWQKYWATPKSANSMRCMPHKLRYKYAPYNATNHNKITGLVLAAQ